MFNEDKQIDILTVSEKLRKQLDQVGGAYYISTLTNRVGQTTHLESHCLILREKEILRAIIESGHRNASEAYENDAMEQASRVLKDAENIAQLCDLSNPRSLSGLIDSVLETASKAQHTGGLTGLPTGFKLLDMIYGGRQNTDLIIKAARPGMGKTAQALCEALNMAKDHKVLFFSLEMGSEQLMQRLISIDSGVPLEDLRKGRLTDQDWVTLNGSNRIKTSGLTIVDDVYTLDGIKAKARKQKIKEGLDVIFVDYLQLVGCDIGKGRNRENEVSAISRGLKMLAKSLKVPVVALSQLSRACESRADKKPMLADLRESGAIEQDADVVEFIYRPEYYGFPDLDGCAYILIEKNRNGKNAEVELRFNANNVRFENKNVPHSN